MTIREAFAPTPEATRELWRWLLDFDWTSEFAADLLPLDHPLFLLLAEPRRLRFEINDGVWVRLLDVGRGTLRAHLYGDGEIVLEVSDELFPENAGRWRVSAAGAERTKADADLRSDVADLATVYLGGFGVRRLVRALARRGAHERRRRASRRALPHHRAAVVPRDLLKLSAPRVAAAWPAVAAIVIVVLTWQTTSLTATAGLDPSWIAGLHLAHANGVGFGPHFVWTYGPARVPRVPGCGDERHARRRLRLRARRTARVRATCSCGAPRRRSPHRSRSCSAYVVLALPIAHADLLFLIVFLYALWALDDPTTLAARAFPVAAGVLAGIAALLKTNTGAAAVGIAIVASWALAPAGRRWLAVIPSLVVTFCVLWLATGNSLLDIPGWLRLSASIVGGYSAAMQDEQMGLRWEYLVAGILVALLAAVVVRHVEGASPRAPDRDAAHHARLRVHVLQGRLRPARRRPQPVLLRCDGRRVHRLRVGRACAVGRGRGRRDRDRRRRRLDRA